VAQRRTWAARHDGSHPAASGIEQRVSDGIDPVVNSMEPPVRKANIDSTARDPQRKQLPPRHHSMLPGREASQRTIHPILSVTCRAFTTHIVVNARFVDPDCGHATTLEDHDAHVAR
jgi:hypothetical protein